MNKKVQRTSRWSFRLYIMFFGLFFSGLSYANQSDSLIPYNGILLDREGNVIVSDEHAINKITYVENYWIVESQLRILFGNINESKDFSAAFTKTGNILHFKIKDNLTYLGAERLAYRYQDTDLSVLLDTDGNLISPEGVYFKQIDPFTGGIAKVITQDKQTKYLNLQGEFVSHQAANPLADNPLIDLKYCQAVTLDNLFLCEKDKKITLVNLNTNNSILLKGVPSSINHYHANVQKLYTDHFWLRNYVDGYWIYQLYDAQGKVQYENQFHTVLPFFDHYGWVQFKQYGPFQLINSQGKLIGDQYDHVEVKSFGHNVVTYASKTVPIDSFNKKYFHSILDKNGSVIFYEDEVNNWDGIECSKDIRVLKNKNNEIVWPQDIAKQCLIANYAHSPVVRYYSWDSDKEKAEKYPGLSEKQVLSLVDDILSTLAERRVATRDDLDFSHSSQYIAGPAIINLADVAQLKLPLGYAYINTGRKNSDCPQYLIPAYSNRGKICLSVYNSGYINLAAQKTLLENSKLTNEADYLIKPEIDLASSVMKFAYAYQTYTSPAAGYEQLREIIFDRQWGNIKFINEHIITLTSAKWLDAQLGWQQMSAVNWGELIDPLPGYQANPQADPLANQDSAYPCSSLPLKDSTLSIEYYDFLSEKRCFPLPLSAFFDNRAPVRYELGHMLGKTNRSQLYTYSYEL